MAKDDWAIVVGISKYPGLTHLQGPEYDAKQFFEWVTSKSGGDVKYDSKNKHDLTKNHAVLICSSQYKPQSRTAAGGMPKVGCIEWAFDTLLEIAGKNREAGDGFRVGRRLYLYFSGHGCAPVSGEPAILMANATDGNVHHFPGKPFANYFYRAQIFKEILLFMDCCQERARGGFDLHRPKYIDRTGDPRTTVKKFYAFSAKDGCLSKEVPIHRKMRGVFTATLLQGLSGQAAVSKKTPSITTASLARYLHDNMKTFLPPEDRENLQIAQVPALEHDDLGEHFTITAVPQTPTYTVKISVPAAASGKGLVIREYRLKPVIKIAIATRTCTCQLERGYSTATVSGTRLQCTFEVTGRGKAHVSLA